MCTIKLLRHVRLGMVRFSSISSSQTSNERPEKRQFEPSALRADVRPPPDDPHRPRRIRPHPRLTCHLSLACCCKRRREATASSSSPSSSLVVGIVITRFVSSKRIGPHHQFVRANVREKGKEQKPKTVMTC